MIVVIFSWFVFVNVIHSDANYTCSAAYSCVNETIFTTSNVMLYGYKSGSGSSTTITGTASEGDVYAIGGFSATKIKDISKTNVYARGSHALYYADSICIAGNISCDASNSCCHTNISANNNNNNNNNKIECNGDASCQSSLLSNFSKIYGYGSYSLLNATIEIEIGCCDMTTDIYLYGYNAGYNLNIKVIDTNGVSSNANANATVVNVYCYGNGCNGTVVIGNCSSLSGMIECNIYCDEADSEACPIVVQDSGDADAITATTLTGQDLLFDSVSLGIEFDIQCNNNNNNLVTLDDYQDDTIVNETIMTIENGNLCCRGGYGCYLARNVSIRNGSAIISGTNGLYDDYDTSGERIRLSVESTTDVGINNQSIIYCGASQSCENGILTTNNVIYCGGHQSCNSATFYNANKLYCSGYASSCADSSMYGVENIYITSYQAARGSIIYSNGNGMRMNVYLMSYQAGYNLDIYCNQSDFCNVYCMTAGSCSQGTTTVHCINNKNCNVTECGDIAGSNDTCPQMVNIATPTTDPTIIPTTMPTEFPTVPSQYPSMIPTHMPSVPSAAPSSAPQPTTSPSSVSSGNPSAHPTSGSGFGTTDYNFTSGRNDTALTEVTENEAILSTIDTVATYIAIGAAGILVIVILLRGFHNICWKGSDAADYGSVMMFIHSVVDFWTDALFAYTMYLYGAYIYFYLSALFTVLPLLFSIFLAIYWIFRWRTMTVIVPQRIADYLQSYNISLILFTIMGNFPAAVSFCQSKLFQHPMFTFPLTKKENERLYVWRFINTTVLENLPQLAIQVSYVLNRSDSDDNGSVSLLVGFSLVLTILGLLFSMSATSVIVLKLLVEHNQHVRQVTEIVTKMSLQCDHFKWKHGYTHNILEEAIKHTLRTCDNSKFWIDRSDVQLSIEVFYISNNILLDKKIDVYVETKLTCYTIDTENNVPKILSNTINEFGIHSSLVHKTLIQSCQSQMKLHGRFKISNISTLHEETTNADGGLILATVKSSVGIGVGFSSVDNSSRGGSIAGNSSVNNYLGNNNNSNNNDDRPLSVRSLSGVDSNDSNMNNMEAASELAINLNNGSDRNLLSENVAGNGINANDKNIRAAVELAQRNEYDEDGMALATSTPGDSNNNNNNNNELGSYVAPPIPTVNTTNGFAGGDGEGELAGEGVGMLVDGFGDGEGMNVIRNHNNENGNENENENNIMAYKIDDETNDNNDDNDDDCEVLAGMNQTPQQPGS